MSLVRGSSFAAALGLAILATVVYLPGLPGNFVYDDHRLIVENDGLKRPFEPGRAFLRDYYASDLDRTGLGYYRPIAVLSAELDYRRGGGSSLPFHVTNIVLHATATVLVFALALTIAGSSVAAAACGALFFAVHASHAESVAFISGRVDPLATIFVLAALLLHIRANHGPGRIVSRWSAGVAWLAALFSKEMAVTGPLLIALVEFAIEGWPPSGRRWERLTRYVPYAVAAVVYLPLRSVALGQLLVPSGGSSPLSLFRPLFVLGNYSTWLVLPPRGLHLEPAPATGAWAVVSVCVTVVVLAGGVALWRWGGRRESALLLGCVLVLLPVAQLRPLETLLSERFLYLPSALLAILVARVVGRCLAAPGWRRMIAPVAMGSLALAHVTILLPRVATWRDEVALWTAKEAEDGGSLKARLNLAQTFARRGDHAEALRWYARAKEIAPNLAAGIDAEAAALLGNLGSEEAEKAILDGIEKLPDDAALWNNLGFHRYRKGDHEGATQAFRRSIDLSPGRASAWLGLALTRLAVRDIGAAADAASRALALDPALGLAQAIQAECALRDGRPCVALRLCEGLSLTEPSERAVLERIEIAARAACQEGAPGTSEVP